jgi:acetylornithine/succinyldiaminopimelate/putrescine aminotransferase
MAVAKTIFEVIEKQKLVEHAAALGNWAMGKMRGNPALKGKVADVRGAGLMLGVELTAAPEKFVERMLAKGVMINVTAQKVIRLAPPINITREDWESGVERLMETIAAL